MGEEDTPEEYSDAEVDAMRDNAAFDEISLQEKEIEPDDLVSGDLATRNWGLGNLSSGEYEFNLMKLNTALKLRNVPHERGGFIANDFGDDMLIELDVGFQMSNSKDGMLRKLLRTKKHEIKTERSKGKARKFLDNNIRPET